VRKGEYERDKLELEGGRLDSLKVVHLNHVKTMNGEHEILLTASVAQIPSNG
jgi:hypothetical protein